VAKGEGIRLNLCLVIACEVCVRIAVVWTSCPDAANAGVTDVKASVPRAANDPASDSFWHRSATPN
jgi:hypothetical protein